MKVKLMLHVYLLYHTLCISETSYDYYTNLYIYVNSKFMKLKINESE